MATWQLMVDFAYRLLSAQFTIKYYPLIWIDWGVSYGRHDERAVRYRELSLGENVMVPESWHRSKVFGILREFRKRPKARKS